MFHSLTMQSTDGTEIWPIYPDLFTQLIWKVGMLQVSDVTDDPDFDVAQHIKKIMDSSDQERNIMTLANVSFSYDAEH